MISSMTGFAARTEENEQFSIRLEIKSVNHRYLDIQCRMSEEFRFLEPIIRTQISDTLLRGKVECRVQIEENLPQKQSIQANWQTIQNLAELNHQICEKYTDIAPLSVADIFKMGGVKERYLGDNQDILPVFSSLLASALLEFKADRMREGAQLQEHLLTRLEEMELIISQLRDIFPQLIEQHMNKVRSRLQEALCNIDEDRIKQEFSFFMQKSDIDEEFSRLHTHIDEVRRIVLQKNPKGVGKRLDFLMQELNREANTLGSKAIAAECTQTSVELKVLIEQMREQIQNIE